MYKILLPFLLKSIPNHKEVETRQWFQPLLKVIS